MIHVFLVSDYQLLKEGLKALLEGCPNSFCLIGTAHDLHTETLPWNDSPEVLLLDADGAGDNLVEWLKKCLGPPSPRILLILRYVSSERIERAMSLGAHGVLDHRAGSAELLKTIEKVSAGELWLDRFKTARLIERKRQSIDSPPDEARRLATFTPRERQILAAVVRDSGDPSAQIAARLFISESTLRNHLTAIYEKCGVKSRAGLVAYAFSNQWVAQDGRFLLP